MEAVALVRVWQSGRMSSENVEAIRRIYEAMAQGDFWAAGEVFDPENVWE
jgi:hypothetical protein